MTSIDTKLAKIFDILAFPKKYGINFGSLFSYYLGLIEGAIIHNNRNKQYETYIQKEKVEFNQSLLEYIKNAKHFTSLLYNHLDKVINHFSKTQNITLETQIIKQFVDAISDLNHEYYTITGIDY